MFWNKLTKKVPKAPEYDQPLGLKIGSIINLQLLDFKLLSVKLRMDIPDDDLIVTSYGMATLDGLTKLHHFYTDSNDVFKVVTENDVVKEVSIHKVYDSVYPASAEDWDNWIGPEGLIGDPTFELPDGTVYERVLFEDSVNHVDPVIYSETISTDINTKDSDYLVEHQSMIYARYLDEDEENIEWLILDAIDTGESAQINILPGFALTENMYKVI